MCFLFLLSETSNSRNRWNEQLTIFYPKINRFAAFMVAGAFLTYLIPNVQDENGRSLSLEELAKGRSRTQKVEGR